MLIKSQSERYFCSMGQHRLLSLFCCLLVSLLFLQSCGARKKTASRPLYGTIDRSRPTKSSGKHAPISDASKARDLDYSSNKLDNYAKLLDVSPRYVNQNANLYYAIDDWMGVPHRMGGQDRKGVDCSAFVTMLYREIYKKDLPRTSRDMAEIVKRKYENQLVEGDLVFFSFGGSNIDHVGIYLHNGKFVHVSSKRGVIISDLRDTWYYRYFKRAGTPRV